MKKYYFVFLFVIFFLITNSINCQTQPARYTKVLRVIDGDTFVLTSGEKIRLLGINTPELDSKNLQEKNLAIKATEVMKSYVKDRTIKLTFDGKTRDIFGRTLAYVWLTNKEGEDSLFIQAELLKSGLARILMYPKDKIYYYLFYNLRNTARKNKLGIWSK